MKGKEWLLTILLAAVIPWGIYRVAERLQPKPERVEETAPTEQTQTPQGITVMVQTALL